MCLTCVVALNKIISLRYHLSLIWSLISRTIYIAISHRFTLITLEQAYYNDIIIKVTTVTNAAKADINFKLNACVV